MDIIGIIITGAGVASLVALAGMSVDFIRRRYASRRWGHALLGGLLLFLTASAAGALGQASERGESGELELVEDPPPRRHMNSYTLQSIPFEHRAVIGSNRWIGGKEGAMAWVARSSKMRFFGLEKRFAVLDRRGRRSHKRKRRR